MATELASLVLRMSADSAQLRADIKKVQTDMGKMRKSARSLESGFEGMSRTLKGAFAALGVGLGVTSIVRSIDRITSSLDLIAKTASRVGVTTDQLQELRFAATQSGVTVEQLDKSLEQLARRLGEAAQGQGELKTILDQYNISVRDANGNTRASFEIIEELSKVLQRAESDVERARIAYQAFGRAGIPLVNMLRGGTEGLEEMMNRAREFGLVVDREAIEASVNFRDRLDELTTAFNVMQAEALAPLLPKITEFVIGLRDTVREGGGARKVLDDLTESLEEISKLVGVIALAGFGLSRGGPLGALITGGAGALAIYREEIGKWLAVPELKRLLDGEDIGSPKLLSGDDPFADLRSRVESGEIPRVTISDTPTPQPLPIIRPGSDETDKAAERRTKQIQSIIASLQEEAATYGMTAEQIAVYKLEQLGASDAQLAMARALTEKIDLLADEEEAMEASRQAAEEAAEAIHQSRLEDQKLIETLAEEIQLMQLGERERAQERAARQLSTQATEEQREAVRNLAGELYDLQDAAKEATFSIEEFAREGARDIQDALGDQLFNFMQGQFDDIAGSFKQMLDRMVADALAAKIGEALMGSFAGGGSLGGFFGSILPSIAGVFGGGGGGNAAAAGAGAAGLDSLIGGFLTGGLAAGGPALPGNMYLVGEEGPELFAPGVAGRVIPNDAMPSGVTVNINVSGVRDDGHLRQSASQVAAQAAVALQRASRRNN